MRSPLCLPEQISQGPQRLLGPWQRSRMEAGSRQRDPAHPDRPETLENADRASLFSMVFVSLSIHKSHQITVKLHVSIFNCSQNRWPAHCQCPSPGCSLEAIQNTSEYYRILIYCEADDLQTGSFRSTQKRQHNIGS